MQHLLGCVLYSHSWFTLATFQASLLRTHPRAPGAADLGLQAQPGCRPEHTGQRSAEPRVARAQPTFEHLQPCTISRVFKSEYAHQAQPAQGPSTRGSGKRARAARAPSPARQSPAGAGSSGSRSSARRRCTPPSPSCRPRTSGSAPARLPRVRHCLCQLLRFDMNFVVGYEATLLLCACCAGRTAFHTHWS